jgi:predicted nucleic acid-binding protein
LYLEYKAKLVEAVDKALTPLSRKQIDSILSALAFYCSEVPVFFRLRPNLKDENDNMVFECAVNFGASTIVTHNVPDFAGGELSAYELEIMTPGRFIRKIRR